MEPARPELSVILPAYREEENLRVLLPRLKQVLAGLDGGGEVLVVDTMTAMDLTPDVCAQEGVAYLNRAGGNSYGDAVRTGIARAAGRYILFMDADGSHTPEFIPRLFARRDPRAVVVASRYAPGGHTENPRSLILMSLMVNLVYALVLGIRCRDVSNSFKLYPADLIKPLRLTCPNFDVVEELLFKAVRAEAGLDIVELPYVFKKRMFGQTKRNLPLFMLTYLWSLIRLRFGK
ncbi:MAG: glycosyltransferase [Thermodesulfobacteriota bacterium]